MKRLEASGKQLLTAPTSGEGLEEEPLLLDDVQGITLLRPILEAADYSEAGIQKALGTQGETILRAIDVPLHLRRLTEASPLSTLIKLFLVGVTVEAGEAGGALAPLTLDRLESMGLLRRKGTLVHSPLRLIPYSGFVLACDRYIENPAELRPDYVIGVNPSSTTLASLTIRRPVQSVLDVGTGCGVQALLAARHSGQVIAVDINPRALNLTAFNARLNSMPQVECRQGSLFDPVAGSRFDLIICNPPYVISPESRYQFRDSGLPGDAISREVVRQAPAHLSEGGFAHILCDWVHRRDEDWSLPLRDWVRDSGCDAWLLHYNTGDPLAYAAVWNQPLQLSDLAAYAGALDRWLDYYRQSGIEAISSGAVVLRRRSGGQNWVRADELPPGRIDPCGDHILRIFEAQDYLAETGDDRALLSEALQLVESHRLEQTLRYRNGRYEPQDAVLRLEQGLSFQGKVDSYALQLLSRCDGQRRLGDLLVEVARDLGLEPDVFTSGALPVVRRLLELGFLVRVRPEEREGRPTTA